MHEVASRDARRLVLEDYQSAAPERANHCVVLNTGPS
jgi:hypothetical protein